MEELECRRDLERAQVRPLPSVSKCESDVPAELVCRLGADRSQGDSLEQRRLAGAILTDDHSPHPRLALGAAERERLPHIEQLEVGDAQTREVRPPPPTPHEEPQGPGPRPTWTGRNLVEVAGLPPTTVLGDCFGWLEIEEPDLSPQAGSSRCLALQTSHSNPAASGVGQSERNTPLFRTAFRHHPPDIHRCRPPPGQVAPPLRCLALVRRTPVPNPTRQTRCARHGERLGSQHLVGRQPRADLFESLDERFAIAIGPGNRVPLSPLDEEPEQNARHGLLDQQCVETNLVHMPVDERRRVGLVALVVGTLLGEKPPALELDDLPDTVACLFD